MNIFVSVVLSIFTFLFSVFGGWLPVDAPKDVEDDFVPVMRFVAASDTHVITLGDTGCRRIMTMMKQAYALSDADADYNTVDAVLFAGDVTDDGTMTAYAAFAATTNVVLREETTRLAVVAKSHDCNTYGKGALDIFTQVTGQETDIHAVVNGFHFIGLSTSHEEAQYTAEQVEWLDRELAAAVADAPEQPVFVFHHEHVSNTVFGSYDHEGWGLPVFIEVLEKYPQVVDISGHSHYPSHDPRSIWQDSFTAIGEGGLAYVELSVDGVNSIHPTGSKTVAQALIVEVDAANRVLVKVLDITAGEILCTYLIDNVTDPVKTKYSHETRSAAAKAPVFAEDAALSFKKGVINSTFTVPQATTEEGNDVYLYRLTVLDEAGEELYAKWEFSQHFFAERPDSIDIAFSMPKGAHSAQVVAEDVWGHQSTPLTYVF